MVVRGLELAPRHSGRVAGGGVTIQVRAYYHGFMVVEVPEVTRCRRHSGRRSSRVLGESKWQWSQIIGVDEMSRWS